MKKCILVVILVAVMSAFMNELVAEEEVVRNVVFLPAVNNPGSPIVRCEFCGRVLGEEVEAWSPALDPEFKKYRLYQVCTKCAAKLYPKDYYTVIMKKKWVLLEYHIAYQNGGLNQFWAKHGPKAGDSSIRMLAKADLLQ